MKPVVLIMLAIIGLNQVHGQNEVKPISESARDAAKVLSSLGSALSSAPVPPPAGTVLRGLATALRGLSFLVRVLASTVIPPEDERSELMVESKLLFTQLQATETREARMAELLQWSSYKHLYMEYVMDIQALYDIVVQISNNQTDLQELKHKSSGDTSPDKFFNLLISPIAIEEGNTFFQAAFRYFGNNIGKTRILMEDAIIWLTKAATVDLMVYATYDYSDPVYNHKLAAAEREWNQRITTLQEALQNTEKMARANVEVYVKEELDSYFKDVSSNNLTSQAEELGSILDAKFDWIRCRINLFDFGEEGLSLIKHEQGICSQMSSFHFTCFKDSCSVSSHYIIYCSNKTNPTYNSSPSPKATPSTPEVEDKSPERTLIDSRHTHHTRLVFPADLDNQLAVDSECIRLYRLEMGGQEYVMYVDECTSKQLVEVSCHHFERGLFTYNQVYVAAGVAGGVLLLLLICCCCRCCCKNKKNTRKSNYMGFEIQQVPG